MTLLQHIRKLMGFLLLLPVYLSALSEPSHPFKYDLHLSHFPAKSSKVMICFHGMGGNYQIAQFIEEYAGIDETLISFNFPDYGRFNIAFNRNYSGLHSLTSVPSQAHELKLANGDLKNLFC